MKKEKVKKEKAPKARKEKKVKENPKSVLEILGDDPQRVWYPIDNKFNGYEVSDDCYVRSLKLLKNGYGCLIKPVDGKYLLTNSEGEKVSLTMDEIKEMAKANPFCERRKTSDITSAGRNKAMFQEKSAPVEEKSDIHKTRFTIAKDDSEKVVLSNVSNVQNTGAYYLDGVWYQ